MVILVVGATGTVGREVVRELMDRGERVRAFSRRPEEAKRLMNPAVDIVAGNLAESPSIEAALKGISKAFLNSSANPDLVTLQGNFVKAARKAGLQQIVKLSTLGASLKSPFAQGRWHRQVEMQIEELEIGFTFLRSHNFMQNTLNFAQDIASRGVLRAPLGEGRISMVDARDVARVVVRALTEDGHAGQIYRLTGPEALSYQQVAEKISAAVGKKVEYVHMPNGEALRAMLEAGTPQWYAEEVVGLYRHFRQGRGERITDEVFRLTKDAPTTFDQFARDYASVFRGDFRASKPGIL